MAEPLVERTLRVGARGGKLVAAALILTVALAACGPSAPKSIAIGTSPGWLSGPDCPQAHSPTAATVCVALKPGGRLAIMLWGSSSCPTVPTWMKVLSPVRIRVVTSDDYGHTACTSDLRSSTYVIKLDTRKVDVTQPLVVEVRLPLGRERTVIAAPAPG